MFKNMKLGTKLGFAFGVILLLLVGIGAAGNWETNSISSDAISEFHEMLNTDAAIAEHGVRARANVVGLRRYEKDLFLNIGSKEKEEEYLKKWREQHEHALARINDLEKAATLQQDKDAVKSMKTDIAAYGSGFGKVYEMIREGKIKTPQEGNKAINEYKDTIHRLEQSAASFSTEGSKKMAGIENKIKAAAKQTSLIMIIFSAVSVIIGVIISILLTRSITRPINRIIEGVILHPQSGWPQVAPQRGAFSLGKPRWSCI